ncbi:hypothetical protein [Plantactinospora sp. KLBMP9567]|uniref:hypothetical protein n=1 Tax=Plantactinospora sp. KLBMP9567 TaxID=3085900 RepID=UPI00399076EE
MAQRNSSGRGATATATKRRSSSSTGDINERKISLMKVDDIRGQLRKRGISGISALRKMDLVKSLVRTLKAESRGGTGRKATTAPSKRTSAKKAPAKRAAAKKAPSRTVAAKKAPARKASTARVTGKKAPARKTTAKKAPAGKTTAKKAPAKRATAKKAPARKAPAKKAPARKTVSAARKAPARKAVTSARTTSAAQRTGTAPARKATGARATGPGKATGARKGTAAGKSTAARKTTGARKSTAAPARKAGGARKAASNGGGQSKSLKYAQPISSPQDTPERPGRSLVTRDHDVIRRWAEGRNAQPATIEGTEREGRLGVLTFDFPGWREGGRLKPVSWDEWFHTFDLRQLNFIYQEQLSDGRQSNFFRTESPMREDG